MKTNQNQGATSIFVVAGIFILSKLKFFLPLIKFLKIHTLVTMFVSMGAYALFYGWKFAAGFIYLLFIHELGHLVAAKRKGIPTSAAIFIPFLGALIAIDPKKIKDAKTEAYLAYGGPLFGLMSLIPLAALYAATKDPFWALMIQVGGMLNLLNLIPVSPLDGGRIVTVLSTNIWLIGLIVLGIFGIVSGDPFFFLIFIIGAITWWERVRESFTLKQIKVHIQVLNRQIARVEKLKEELTELPPLNIDVYSDKLCIDDTFKSWQNAVAAEQKVLDRSHFKKSKSLRKGFLPFIHDDKKLKKHEAELDFEYTREFKKLHWPISRDEMESLLSAVQTYFKEKQVEVESEKNKLKSYYETDLKTKLIVLTLYLLLGVILALAVNFGVNILEQHPVMIGM